MDIQVVMPQMGESVAEGTVITWLKKFGEVVAKDEPLVAISTDKVDVEIPSPAAGVLSNIMVQEGQVAAVGAVLAYISETSPTGAVSPESPIVEKPAHVAQAAPIVSPTTPPQESWYSPAVLELAKEQGVDLSQVRGTGSQGRVTRKDLLDFIDQR